MKAMIHSFASITFCLVQRRTGHQNKELVPVIATAFLMMFMASQVLESACTRPITTILLRQYFCYPQLEKSNYCLISFAGLFFFSFFNILSHFSLRFLVCMFSVVRFLDILFEGLRSNLSLFSSFFYLF